jgi:hypothetical protein
LCCLCSASFSGCSTCMRRAEVATSSAVPPALLGCRSPSTDSSLCMRYHAGKTSATVAEAPAALRMVVEPSSKCVCSWVRSISHARCRACCADDRACGPSAAATPPPAASTAPPWCCAGAPPALLCGGAAAFDAPARLFAARAMLSPCASLEKRVRSRQRSWSQAVACPATEAVAATAPPAASPSMPALHPASLGSSLPVPRAQTSARATARARCSNVANAVASSRATAFASPGPASLRSALAPSSSSSHCCSSSAAAARSLCPCANGPSSRASSLGGPVPRARLASANALSSAASNESPLPDCVSLPASTPRACLPRSRCRPSEDAVVLTVTEARCCCFGRCCGRDATRSSSCCCCCC